MLITNELRWFYPGIVPPEIKLWFEQNCLTESSNSPEKRTDWYLYSPSDFIGIKLREGRLEVKWRQAELGTVRFGASVEGNAEKWAKWMCYDSTGEIQPKTVSSNPEWLSVQKVRYSQIYQVLPDFSVQPVSAQENIDNTCNVELTSLVVRDTNWWSLAFEASGQDTNLMNNLQATTNLVFNTYDGSKFRCENSYAYPTWLKL
jgi:hypothetical protein